MIIKSWSNKVVVIPYNCVPYIGIGSRQANHKMLSYEISPEELAIVQESVKRADGKKIPAIKIYCNYNITRRQLDTMFEYLTAAILDMEFFPVISIEECLNLNLLRSLDDYVQLLILTQTT